MKRNIQDFKSTHFDVLIIGGGITGSCLAFDFASRGYKVALIEKNDYGWATSMATSKMLHGGLRYLAQLDISVVRESLIERQRLTQLAPHQAFPLPFLFPIYEDTPTKKWMLHIGISLYDLLHWSAPVGKDKSKTFPNYKWYSKEEILKLEPNLNPHRLQGGFVYYDAQNLHPERMNIDFIKSAESYGSVVANYVKADSFIQENYNGEIVVRGVKATDLLTNQNLDILAKVVINASGPWGFDLLSKLYPLEKNTRKLIRSKGIHLLFPKRQKDHALTFNTRDNKHFFVLPWLDYTLIGTTDSVFNDSSDHVYVTKKEANELINLVNEYYPVNFKYENLLHAYAGIRPLIVKGDAKNSYKVSRKHEIIDHKKENNISNLVSVFGGKYTTSRGLAEEVVNMIQHTYKLGDVHCKTRSISLKSADFKDLYSNYIQNESTLMKDLYPVALIKHLIEYYGVFYKDILKYGEENLDLLQAIDPSNIRIKAEIDYAIKNESAITLSDFLYRRSGWGNEGLVDLNILHKIASHMGKILNWSTEQIEHEIKLYLVKQTLL